MIQLFAASGHGLTPMPEGTPPGQALWIDLLRPTGEEVAEVERLGISVPSLQDMEEIEISNRLYRDQGHEFMTALLPGQTEAMGQASMPVTFISGHGRLVTVRHHSPRPFETFPLRAGRSSAGCASGEHLFLGLIEEILGRQADHLEGVSRTLDETSRAVFSGDATQKPAVLQSALLTIAAQGEILSRVTLGLMTLERAVAYFGQALEERPEAKALRAHAKARLRDLQALQVHADFLSGRLSQAMDATLGMVNLAQNMTVRILSVVAALFLPPTLIASAYGMNFSSLPAIAAAPWSFALSLVLMALSALATYLFFRWKNWL